MSKRNNFFGSFTSSVPPTISGLVQWLRGDDVVKDGSNNVSQWTDKSGLGNHCTQIGATTIRPLYVSSGINSKPILRFVDDWLLNPLVLKGSKTIFIVDKINTISASSMLTIKFDGSTYTEFLPVNLGGYQPRTFRHDYSAPNNGVGVADALNTNNHLFIHTYNGGLNTSAASYTADLDNVSKTVVSSGLCGRFSTDKGSLGARVTSADVGSFFYIGDIAEIIIYNRVLTVAEQTTIKTYLNSRYAIF